MNDTFGETIYTYTRAEALSDGNLMDLNQVIPRNESPFKFPVACTSAVWAIIDNAAKNQRVCNDLKGIVWDVLYMASQAPRIGEKLNESTYLYKVIIIGAGRQKKYTFKCLVHPGDNMEPVITIMLPEED
jgi:hypothetical protein